MSSAFATQERHVSAAAAEQAPRLVAPVGGVPVDGSAVMFSWAEVPGARDYRVEVAADADFEQVVCRLQTGPTTLFTLLEMLPEDGSVFHWRVQAQTAAGWQPWSTREQFRARTDQHEIAFREKQETAAKQGASRAAASTTASAEAPTALYQVSHTSKGTMALILAIMLATFAATFAYIAYVVNTAQ